MKTYQLPVLIDEYIDKYCSDALETIPEKKAIIVQHINIKLLKILPESPLKKRLKHLEEIT
jgi:hypothetical protein